MKNKIQSMWYEICVFCDCVYLAFFGENEDTGDMGVIFNEDGSQRIITKHEMLDDT